MLEFISDETIENMVKICTRNPRYKGLVFTGMKSRISLLSRRIESNGVKNADANGLISRIMNRRDDYTVEFRNGSSIRVCRVNENSRGLRANTIIIDEYIERKIINEVIRPLIREYSTPEGEFYNDVNEDITQFPHNFDKEIVDFLKSFKLKERR